ncbi:MAG: MipA/OmpV family protein [Rhodospirillales bacterium]|jgi:outer membrane scaffolding protein for murein synthesis (MipA/OmpV family)|nr:MipA/OmpV family protein [Rhodospirillales bacterium]
MPKLHNISVGLAVGVSCFVTACSAHAQKWQDTTQQAAPDVPPAEKVESKKNWNFVIGGGVGYAPTYEGSDEYDILPIPVVSIDYKKGLFFANVRNGIGSYPLQGKNYKVGASVAYAPGRKEDDDNKNLRGMGDLDAAATANLLAEYSFGPAQLSGIVKTGISGDFGTTVEANFGTRHSVTDKIIMSGSVGLIWADKEHMNNRFGVSSSQSTASGYSQYDAGSGIKSAGFSVGATYLLTEKWNVNLTFKGDKLLGDAADSPIVKNEFVPSAFLTTSYKF